MNKRAIIGIVITLFLLTAGSSFAAVPLLQDFLGAIPKPVTNFFNMLQGFNFGSGDLPAGATTAPSSFLNFLWSLTLIFLKGVGSVFVWVFHAIANGLDSIIFSR